MNPYLRFSLERLAQAVVVLLLVYVLVFAILTVLPGDPVSNRLRNPENNYTEEEIARLLTYYGLDRSLWEQLGLALRRALSGDLGISLLSSTPVTTVLAEALPTTLVLGGIALVLSLLLGFVVAVGGVYLPPARGGNLLRSFPSLFLSLPNFLIGLFLIQFFAFQLGWFQIVRDEGLKSLLLPALTLAVPVSAPVAQIFLTGLDAARSQQFAVTALAKGLHPSEIFALHLLKPASLPTLTIIGLTVGDLIGGAVITESVFALNGIGNVIERSVVDQDIPVLQAVVVLAAVVYIVINLLVDLSYPLLDARLRLTRSAPGKRPVASVERTAV